MQEKISYSSQPLLRQHLGTLAAVAVGVLLSVPGCSDNAVERVPVSGRILIDGEPLAFGTIIVIPKGVRQAGSKIVNGEFSLITYEKGDGTALGTHQVSIYSAKTLGPSARKWMIPKHYAKASKSGLTLTVDGPSDSALFELSWKGGKPFVEKSGYGGE